MCELIKFIGFIGLIELIGFIGFIGFTEFVEVKGSGNYRSAKDKGIEWMCQEQGNTNPGCRIFYQELAVLSGFDHWLLLEASWCLAA